MPNTLTLKPFKELAIINSGWALLIGLITTFGYTSLMLPPLYWSSLVIGLLLTVILVRWGGQQPILTLATRVMLLALVTEFVWGGLMPQATAFNAVTHTVTVTIYLALTLLVATIASLPTSTPTAITINRLTDRFYFRSLLWTGAAILGLLTSGVAMRVMGATVACHSWPLCQDNVTWNSGVMVSLLHRAATVIVGVMVTSVILQTLRHYRPNIILLRLAMLLAALYLAQIGLGALYLFLPTAPFVQPFHLGLSIVMWGGLVILATTFYFAPKSTELELVVPMLSGREKLRLYFQLIKPWVLLLLLLTTIIGMAIAARGLPSVWLMVVTFIGGVCSAGGASVLNSYIDSDIDGKMSRTSRRATVMGMITPQDTLIFGLTLSTLSFLIFMLFVNPLSAALSTLGLIYYVFFYTLYLKRNTIHNIIIGGAAGAIPPLVGWAAVHNSLNLEAFYLFAIIFFWTPPHTWAMALLVKKDYAQVNVPMLPVSVGEAETTYQTLLYSLLLVMVTLLPFTFHMASWFYLFAAIVLGGQFLRLAWRMWQDYNKATSKRLYKYSQRYLALLFLAMAIDRMLLG